MSSLVRWKHISITMITYVEIVINWNILVKTLTFFPFSHSCYILMVNWLGFCFTLFSLLDPSWQSSYCLGCFLLLWKTKWDSVANQSLFIKFLLISDMQYFFHTSLTKASHMVNGEGQWNFNVNQEVEDTRGIFAETQRILP